MWRTENNFQNMPGSTAFEIWLNDVYPTISTVIIIVVCWHDLHSKHIITKTEEPRKL